MRILISALALAAFSFSGGVSANCADFAFGDLNPCNPMGECEAFGDLNRNNPFEAVESPFGELDPNNPFSRGTLDTFHLWAVIWLK